MARQIDPPPDCEANVQSSGDIGLAEITPFDQTGYDKRSEQSCGRGRTGRDGDWDVDVDHLHGGDFVEHAARREPRRKGGGKPPTSSGSPGAAAAEITPRQRPCSADLRDSSQQYQSLRDTTPCQSRSSLGQDHLFRFPGRRMVPFDKAAATRPACVSKCWTRSSQKLADFVAKIDQWPGNGQRSVHRSSFSPTEHFEELKFLQQHREELYLRRRLAPTLRKPLQDFYNKSARGRSLRHCSDPVCFLRASAVPTRRPVCLFMTLSSPSRAAPREMPSRAGRPATPCSAGSSSSEIKRMLASEVDNGIPTQCVRMTI